MSQPGITYRGTVQIWHCRGDVGDHANMQSLLIPDPTPWDVWPPERAFLN